MLVYPNYALILSLPHSPLHTAYPSQTFILCPNRIKHCLKHPFFTEKLRNIAGRAPMHTFNCISFNITMVFLCRNGIFECKMWLYLKLLALSLCWSSCDEQHSFLYIGVKYGAFVWCWDVWQWKRIYPQKYMPARLVQLFWKLFLWLMVFFSVRINVFTYQLQLCWDVG